MDGAKVMWRAVGAILLLALLLRLGAAYAIQTRIDSQPGRFDLIEGDASGYWELARRIVHGEPYELYTPPRRVLRMPGFPVIIASGIACLGERPGAVRCLLALLGTLGCGLVFGLTRTIAGTPAALIATTAAAISPTFVVFSVLYLSETAFAVALVASLWSLVLLFRRIQPRTVYPQSSSVLQIAALATGAGLLAALATHMRPTWIIASPIAALGAVIVSRGKSGGWIAAAGLLVGLALLIAPWALRNQRVTGHLVPTTLWFGASLYDGLRPGATGGSEMSFIEQDGIYSRLSEYDADRYYRDQALGFARTHPMEAVTLGLNKLGRYFSLLPNADQFANWPARLATGAWSMALLGLAAIGAWSARSNRELLAVSLLPLLFFAAVHAVFVGSLRYRLPAEYPLLALSATGAITLWNVCISNSTSRPERPPC